VQLERGVTVRFSYLEQRAVDSALQPLGQFGGKPDDLAKRPVNSRMSLPASSGGSSCAPIPAGALKIDRSFVSIITTDPTQPTVVRSIISLAHWLRLKVIAEGVETEEQAVMLSALGCDVLQGYLLARPLPRDQVAGLLS
jgi:hypothetical protein